MTIDGPQDPNVNDLSAPEPDAGDGSGDRPETALASADSGDVLPPSDVDLADLGLEKTSAETRLDRLVAESREADYAPRRIRQLEMALEQCQGYIHELKATLSDQEFLATQLAATEEYSHIQQQAISTLQDQLRQFHAQDQQIQILQDQRQALSLQLDEQHHELIALRAFQSHSTAEQENLHQQIHNLREQLQQSQDSIVQSTQQRIISQKTVDRLRQDIRRQQEEVSSLEWQLNKAKETLQRYESIIQALQKSQQPDSQKNLAIQDLSATLYKAQNKIASLENELAQQTLIQARLQQASSELEQQSLSAQERIEHQEQQIAEMQEQILHQAQQGREYETAIQHWKDRLQRYEDAFEAIWPILQGMQRQSSKIPPQLLNAVHQVIDQYFQA
ncbi:hypothetical protein [Lyngbya confervoides]|uniref:Chromosome partition protein Smc n=1 Tax=Lyngbya confervoides BDU141951 TaxID=1574623 RepID=A0ABD4T9P2_9CYAN|nr:hypothetical protein [Lyngbya confervoides]MCM1985017.1 hypothetical protein [Lyngbya confervoides BDU141951]